MRKIVIFIFAALIIISCITNSNVYISLEKADSLMNYLPDSSLNILKSIRYSALKTNQEKAYYALLYTQCLHKNYLPIVNDSLISLAVDYYLHEKEWDKYAKSLIYKGISLEEMYMNTMAMEMYKKAEEISAESSDFLLKGLMTVH